MEKEVAAIELCSKSIKIVIGYVLDGKVHVIYTLTKEVGHIFNRGNLEDPTTLKSALEMLTYIDDPSAKLRINIQDALIAIPPYGVEVYQTKPVVPIIGDDGKVGEFDIKNAYQLVRKSNLPPNAVLVDIIPSSFILDQGQSYAYPPLGQASNSLQIYAKIHTLPSNIYYNYVNAIKESGVNIRRTIVSSSAAIELLASFGDEYPSDYFLVDIGSDVTTVSLVGYKQLYCSRFFSWGGDNITKDIAVQFDVDETEAEKIKMLYGYDKRTLSFDAIVATSEENGQSIHHRVSHLNNLIENQLLVFSRELNNALTSLLENYPDNEKYRALPMVMIGGGSSLYGLKDFLKDKLANSEILIATPNTLGARNPSYFNCLGMILMNSKYPNAYDDSQKKVVDLTREPKEEKK